MRTIETIVYKFNELSDEAKQKAICDQIKFEIETMDENSPFWPAVLEMEAMQTPWFLAETLYHTPAYKEILIETIEANDYEFTKDGKMI